MFTTLAELFLIGAYKTASYTCYGLAAACRGIIRLFGYMEIILEVITDTARAFIHQTTAAASLARELAPLAVIALLPILTPIAAHVSGIWQAVRGNMPTVDAMTGKARQAWNFRNQILLECR